MAERKMQVMSGQISSTQVIKIPLIPAKQHELELQSLALLWKCVPLKF